MPQILSMLAPNQTPPGNEEDTEEQSEPSSPYSDGTQRESVPEGFYADGSNVDETVNGAFSHIRNFSRENLIHGGFTPSTFHEARYLISRSRNAIGRIHSNLPRGEEALEYAWLGIDRLENNIRAATEMLMAITAELNYVFAPDGFSDDEDDDGMDYGGDDGDHYERDIHSMGLAVVFPPPATPASWDAANPDIHANTER